MSADAIRAGEAYPNVTAMSVVIPVRNDRANLERCLASLKASTHHSFEVLVIDDASTDATPDVAERMGVRVVRLQQNRGPAAARNRGAELAQGDLLVFIDADVCVDSNTLQRFQDAFDRKPEVDAVFGSYCVSPEHRGLYSQYRNLVHHYVHQTSNAEATTFWSGCGAVRKTVFLQHGGFDSRYAQPCIEDIEFGVRLSKAGHHIELDPSIQATHLKRWTLWKMVKTDIFDRGVPWTRLMLEHGSMPNDLNLRVSQRVSALVALAYGGLQAISVYFQPLTILFPVIGIFGVVAADYWRVRTISHRWLRRTFEIAFLLGIGLLAYLCGVWSLVVALPLLVLILLNLRFYWFFVRCRSLTFTIFVLPLHVLYYWYSVAAYAIGLLSHLHSRSQPKPSPQPQTPHE